ncbi:MAG: sulfotransferase domain-containing protein [Planctomycetota bacterium]
MTPHTEVHSANAHGLDLDWERRDREIGEISAKYREVKELNDGYAFRYPSGESWQTRIRDVRDHYTRHFPYFTTEIAVEPGDGSVWLRITGPDGAKELLERGLDYAAGKVKKDGTENLSAWEKLIKVGGRRATWWCRSLPDFLVIGAAKAGTTSLFSYLSEHPNVAPVFRKEIYFFDMHWGRGARWYRSQFPTVFAKHWARRNGRPLLAGEATPCYMFHPHVPKRVLELVPKAKLIVLLRNPVDRAYSYYCMNARRGLERLSFEEAIDREEERLQGELARMEEDESYFSLKRHHCSYLARGLYADQLRHWMRWFPRQQFLIMTNKELRDDRQGTLARAQEFLGLPVRDLPDTGRRNYIPYPELASETRKRLVEHFAPHNQQLYDLLGRRYDWDR